MLVKLFQCSNRVSLMGYRYRTGEAQCESEPTPFKPLYRSPEDMSHSGSGSLT